MSSNSPIYLLLGVLAVLTVAGTALVGSYNLKYRDLRKLQPQLLMANNLRAQMNQFVGALGGELLEYSKKNPAIDPLLSQYGFKRPATNVAPAAPMLPPQR